MPLGKEEGLGPGDLVLDGDAAPPRKGAQQHATFRPMSIVAIRSPISVTAELLFQFLAAHRVLLLVVRFWPVFRGGG